MKYIAAAVLALIVVAAGWWFLRNPYTGSSTVDQPPTSSELAPEVEKILSEKMALLSTLATEPAFVEAVQSSNQKNASLSPDDIRRLDLEWQGATEPTPFISQFMENAIAKRLIAFQKSHLEFKEIFIADAHGLNMAQTDRTSDYYQADESWWIQSFNEGRGRVLHGTIEFDESSQTEAISIYIPVKNDNAQAIGVIKGVIDLSAISSEL